MTVIQKMYHGHLAVALSVLIVIITGGKGTAGQSDPCSNATALGDLEQRVVGYKYSVWGALFGDNALSEGWYSMEDYIITKSNSDCGTVYPWHREGVLPDDSTEAELEVCNKGCILKKTIKVRKCSMEKYVFYLVPLETSYDGYCLERLNPADFPAPKINFTQPTISVDALRINGSNNLHFYCDFTPTDSEYLYTVEWSLTSGSTGVQLIHKTESIPYEYEFQNRTALFEDHLKARNAHQLGFTIICTVSAKRVADGNSSNAISSSPTFCGIKVHTTYCIQSGTCFVPNDENGCYSCSTDQTGKLIWNTKQVKGCAVTSGTSSIEWFVIHVPAVLTSVVVVVLKN